MESDYHWLITIGLVTSSVIAVTANIFLLIIFCRRRSLRTVPNRFVINLLIANLLSSVLLIPLLLVDQEASAALEPVVLDDSSNRTTLEGVMVREEVLSNTSESIEIIETTDVRPGSPTRNTIEIIETSDVFTSVAEEHTTADLLCVFAHSTTSFVCTASIFSILLIGINQYFGVIHSLRYHFYINRCRSSILIGISWLVALLCAILSSLTYSDSTVWHFCRAQPASLLQSSDILKVLNTVYALGYFLLVILAPFVAICVIYVCIYSAAHQNSERMRRSASAPLNPQADYIQAPAHKQTGLRDALPKVHSAPNFSSIEKEDVPFKVEHMEIQTVPSTVNRTISGRSFITTIKHKISNASVFRYREETRAAKISVLVIFLVLVCYVPYGITLILSSKCVDIKTSQIFNYVSLILLVFSNIISPFLFGYRNKRVKREICKMFDIGTKHSLGAFEKPRRALVPHNRSFENVNENFENEVVVVQKNRVIPEVIVTCKPENERKSILKRVCSSSNWTSYKKCNFITVPDSCISGEARGSFSSASTQISTEE